MLRDFDFFVFLFLFASPSLFLLLEVCLSFNSNDSLLSAESDGSSVGVEFGVEVEFGKKLLPQLRTINPDAMHKRAAAATATSPLLSFDVSGCFIRNLFQIITLHCGWRVCARSHQELSCGDADDWV